MRMTEEKKEEEKEEKKESDSGDGSGQVTEGKVRELIDDALKPIKDLLTGDDDSGDSDDSGEKKSKAEEARERLGKKRGSSYAQTEQDAFDKVRQAVKEAIPEAIAELEHSKEHEEIKQKKKQEPQSAPIKVRRLTRLMLGKDYGKD